MNSLLNDSQGNTVGFRSVLTSIPVSQMKQGKYVLEEDINNGSLSLLAKLYKERTGIAITNEYQLHIFHIDEILRWEETKEVLGPFFTMALLNGHRDPLKYIATLMVTGRVHKNLVVIEVDDKRKLSLIESASIKMVIESETIYIEKTKN